MGPPTPQSVFLQELTSMTTNLNQQWYEKVNQAVERIDYIIVVQQGRDVEE
jgi:hypothetical protein